MNGFTAKDPLCNTASFTFGSEAANLEYSILTAILGDPSSEGNPTSDSHSSASPPPSVHHFSTPPSEYPASWTSAPGNSLLHSEPNGFFPSPLVTVSGIQIIIFEISQLTLPSTDRSQTGSGSPSSDFLSQTFTSIDPGSSATSASAHIPQDTFTTPASSVTSPALNPLAPRWPLSSAESA
jgi:hypothetical protein